VGLPFQALYSATKFALAGYSESLKLEVAPFGVRVSLVEPGDYATGFTRRRRLVCDRADSPYRERYRRALSATVAAETRNQDLRPFVAAVLRAVGRPTARLRYPCAGVPERLYVALRPLLPQAVAERLLLNATGLGD
jgi:short-subunit dehydrogenase